MGAATRDLPHSASELFTGWVPRVKKELTMRKADRLALESEDDYEARMIEVNKLGWKKYLPIVTTGSGLFSDGYVNNSIGTVSTCLSILYPEDYLHSHAIRNVTSIAFAGTVVGMLVFGYIADFHSRKTAMLWGTIILIVMTILTSGVWAGSAHNLNVKGMLTALTVYRFFLGIGIGSEYPAGSTACSEASAMLPPGKRNRWFCWFTNFMIDFGFVISAFVPMVLLWICGTDHLTPVWRVTLGIGAIPPISLFILRMFYKEGETFQKTRFKRVYPPYWAVIKFYWFRLLIVSLIWFIYDYSAYAFGLFSSYVLANVMDDSDLYQVFGWNVVINLFYIPGAFLGAIAADYFGPRLTLIIGVTCQSIIGYAMAGSFETLQHSTAGFVVLYGIFMTLGEFGPGDNIGLLASKTSCTPVRGQYYGIAAAIGKVGAFTGTYVFTPLVDKHGIKSAWWLASSLGLFAAALALFFLPPVDQNAMHAEDEKFLDYLESIGFDISLLGDVESIEADASSDGSLHKDAQVTSAKVHDQH
ncbi:CYFA0S23e01156g1_1 [Cyberlindnera fabianii]|uniref:CYFA0S23e01156g1_1 n=1 Tax=Cyberlindnera fabianii TaxID=36022 RepID=A0A061BEX8_CYBFA|nr:putative metabolite transport protein GIT1 [Cyberlindnera fabianii]CDR46456.1 CYFA0S23e01156g1_1 [Cyberlindnera fabianii]